MDIRQVRVVVRSKNFDRSCRFYEDVLGLPRLDEWEAEGGRGVLYQAGNAAIEVLGRSEAERGSNVGSRGWDEIYDYQGPEHKVTLTLVVASAEKAYETLFHRDKNIPGGLLATPQGRVFKTHDPDGLQIHFLEDASAPAERERAESRPSRHAPQQQHGGWAGDRDWADRGRT